MRKYMRRIKLISVCLIAVCLGMFLGGCAFDNNKTEFKYENPEIVEGFILYKSVYEENKLTLYFDSNLYENYRVYSTSEIDCEKKSDRVIITADDVSTITSLAIEDSEHRYELRYLNTNQYAVLAYSMAYDYGWLHYGGRKEDFYTQEELDEQRRQEEEREALFDANWAILEGCYEADNGNHIDFFVDSGYRTMREGEYLFTVTSIIIEDTGEIHVECDAGWAEYMLTCTMADDASYIVAYDYDLKEDVTYYR